MICITGEVVGDGRIDQIGTFHSAGERRLLTLQMLASMTAAKTVLSRRPNRSITVLKRYFEGDNGLKESTLYTYQFVL
jgi:hypothetical protein